MEREYIVKYVNETNGIFTKSEPLIRCKDCRHYDSETQSCLDGLDGIFQPDWYCADGEWKDGGVE